MELVRSWMFVPASQERFLRKLPSLPVDGVFLDLEDGVPPNEKDKGRKLLAAYVQAGLPQRPISYVRINSLGHDNWRDDITAAIGAVGVVVPKVESGDDIGHVDAALTAAETATGRPGGSTAIIAAIESAEGLAEAAAIAKANPRLTGLLFGAEDYALDLGLPANRTGLAVDLIYARSTIVNAARAAGRMAIDGVYPVLDDEPALRAHTQQARDLGFTGKSLFHPQQIRVINEVFSPSPDEIDYSREVVREFEIAHASGAGAVAVRGQLVDLPIVERARRTLAFADALARSG
ncbi:HpcH/HpaI aldolase/citrate lyase family protein [Plantactinospora sp. GCM10030261]|uniref:HpcH/HpaI aldolase/citrate lyase family protein n=1 Tax=Plantactinospora sp. GCM10030261 TaxID=3273420 RepID=UPI00360B831B